VLLLVQLASLPRTTRQPLKQITVRISVGVRRSLGLCIEVGFELFCFALYNPAFERSRRILWRVFKKDVSSGLENGWVASLLGRETIRVIAIFRPGDQTAENRRAIQKWARRPRHANGRGRECRRRTADAKQMPFGIEDLFKVGLIRDCLDASLQRQDFVVTAHHRDGGKFEALDQVHRPDDAVASRSCGCSRQFR
jgi:hypothetical protein